MAKYSKKIVNSICELIKADTFTVNEICQKVGITKSTFYQWCGGKSDFSDAVKKAKEELIHVILDDCNNSLKKLIRGYDYEEVVEVYAIDKNDNKRVKKRTVVKKHIAPNLGAIIHYQTNRDPENWKNRQSTELTGSGGRDLFPSFDLSELEPEQREALLKIAEKFNTGGRTRTLTTQAK